MTEKRNQSREDDKRQEPMSRVNKTHGGVLVESIATEDLESVNDANCKHEKLVRDTSETQFIGFVCSNPDCSEVVLFNKDK